MDQDNFKCSYKLFSPLPGIFHLQIESPHDLAMTFWRGQEHYESSKYAKQKFTFAEYAMWYGKNISSTKCMSYAKDWVGFNVPGWSLHQCYIDNDERTAYDKLMLQVMAACKFLAGGEHYYLIGTSYADEHNAIDHELAHGLYMTSYEYRNEMDALYQEIPKKLATKAAHVLIAMSYNASVVRDELQAHCATGLKEELSFLQPYVEDHEAVFKRHLTKSTNTLLGGATVDLRML